MVVEFVYTVERVRRFTLAKCPVPSSETQRQIVRARWKSKQAGKYGTKKSKERPEEPLWTMSYQTSSKRSPPFWLLIGQKNTNVFWQQSEARTAVTVWNWSGKTLSLGALLAVLYFSSCHIFPPVETFPWLHYLPLGLRGWSSSSCDKFLRHFWLLWGHLWSLLHVEKKQLSLPLIIYRYRP